MIRRYVPGLFGAALVALALLLSSCGWERAARISFTTADQIADAGEKAGIPALHALEMAAAKKCGASVPVPTTCPGKDKWQAARHAIEDAIVELSRGILDGRALVLLGQEADAKGMIVKVLALVASLRSQLKSAGVIP